MSILVIGNHRHVSVAPREMYNLDSFLIKHTPQELLKGDRNSKQMVNNACLIMFTGGPDINPVSYGHKRHRNTSYGQKRDVLDGAWLEFALEKKLPIIGVSRGMHLVWTKMGGTLIQHLDGHRGVAPSRDHDAPRTGYFNTVYNHYAVTDYKNSSFCVPSDHKQAIYLDSLPQKSVQVLVTTNPPVSTGNYWVNGEIIKNTPEVEAIFMPEINFLGFQWDISNYDFTPPRRFRTNMHREFNDLFTMHLYKQVSQIHSKQEY